MWSVMRHPDEQEVVAAFGRHPAVGLWLVITTPERVVARYERHPSEDAAAAAHLVWTMVQAGFFAPEYGWAGQVAIRAGKQPRDEPDASVRRAMRVLMTIEGSIDEE